MIYEIYGCSHFSYCSIAVWGRKYLPKVKKPPQQPGQAFPWRGSCSRWLRWRVGIACIYRLVLPSLGRLQTSLLNFCWNCSCVDTQIGSGEMVRCQAVSMESPAVSLQEELLCRDVSLSLAMRRTRRLVRVSLLRLRPHVSPGVALGRGSCVRWAASLARRSCCTNFCFWFITFSELKFFCFNAHLIEPAFIEMVMVCRKRRQLKKEQMNLM